jgi:hypothetical protein
MAASIIRRHLIIALDIFNYEQSILDQIYEVITDAGDKFVKQIETWKQTQENISIIDMNFVNIPETLPISTDDKTMLGKVIYNALTELVQIHKN